MGVRAFIIKRIARQDGARERTRIDLSHIFTSLRQDGTPRDSAK